MNYLQDKIVRNIAKNNNLTLAQIEQIFNKVCEKVRLTIQDFEEDEQGLKDPESFKTIHIQYWGKFVPNKASIKKFNGMILSNERTLKKKYDGRKRD